MNETPQQEPATPIAEYSKTAAALSVLRDRYARRLFDVATSKGFNEARLARAELRDLRVTLEKTRVEIKAPILERERMIDAEAKRITGELVALENPIDEQIKAEEKRRDNARVAREQAERERVERIRAKLLQIQGLALRAIGKSASEIAEALDFARALQVTPETFAEFLDLAKIEHAQAIAALASAYTRQSAAEAEAAAHAERVAEFERQQKRARMEQEADARRIAKEQQDERERLAAIAAAAALQTEENEREAERLRRIAADQERERRMAATTSVTIDPTPEQARAFIGALVDEGRPVTMAWYAGNSDPPEPIQDAPGPSQAHAAQADDAPAPNLDSGPPAGYFKDTELERRAEAYADRAYIGAEWGRGDIIAAWLAGYVARNVDLFDAYLAD